MKIGIPKEISETERRVSVVPKTAAQLIKDGYDVVIESDAGEAKGCCVH
jgi:NAD/NADP transhydrogenase alpha subunit